MSIDRRKLLAFIGLGAVAGPAVMKLPAAPAVEMTVTLPPLPRYELFKAGDLIYNGVIIREHLDTGWVREPVITTIELEGVEDWMDDGDNSPGP